MLLVRAAAQDAGNFHARAAGRSVWDESDYNEAVRVENALAPMSTEALMERVMRENPLPDDK